MFYVLETNMGLQTKYNRLKALYVKVFDNSTKLAQMLYLCTYILCGIQKLV